MSSEEGKVVTTRDNRRRVAVYAAVVAVAFLLGLVPMWLAARGRAAERDRALQELRVSRMEARLAQAAILARRGDYEPARQAASDFFTSVREQTDAAAAGHSVLTLQQRQAVAPILEQRDQIITLLARSDPASAERLSDIYVEYRRVVGDAQQGGR